MSYWRSSDNERFIAKLAIRIGKLKIPFYNNGAAEKSVALFQNPISLERKCKGTI